MLDFYKNTLVGLIGVLLVSVLLAYFCVQHTFPQLELLPHEQSKLRWQAATETDNYQNGNSVAVVNDTLYSLDFDLAVSSGAEYPAASVAMLFENDTGQPKLANLSGFSNISFSIKCSTSNVLTFMVFTLDETMTDPDDFLTYRAPSTFISCDQNWSQVDVDLNHLEMQQWWLEMFQLKLSMNDYQLDKVAKFQFGTTRQSPMNTVSRVQISQLVLHGNNWFYMYLLAIGLFVLWAGYTAWLFRQHGQALTAELKNKILRERPLVAYRQLNMQPQRDKDQDAILRYMATTYANPELNLDIAVAEIGVSRTKINDVLKAELGFTFTGYLNKIRLTEVARLLSEKEEANIAEIAYSVGYKNVSYFNKLFKEEYGCTPKAFKTYLK